MHITSNELSDREREILSLVAKGASNKEIARQLSISTNTVKVHLRNIFGKIGVRSRTEAAMYAVSLGLVAELPGATESSQHAQVEAVAMEAAIEQPGSSLWVPLAWLGGLMTLALAGAVLLYVFVLAPARPVETPIQETPKWKQLPPMPTARSGLATVAYEQAIYAIGGQNAQGASSAVERFDPVSKAWKVLSPKPTPVYEIGAAVISGKVYVPGGRLASGQVTDILEVYDPRQDAWTTAASLPVAVSAYGLAAIEGRLYLFGGWDGQEYVNRVYEYNPETNRWQEKTAMPTSRGYLGVAQIGESLYVLGGYDGKNALRVNEIYKPGLDGGSETPWSKAPEMPEGRYRMGVVSAIDLLLAVGGLGANEQIPFSYQFSVQSDDWVNLEYPGTQHSWYDLGATVLGTNLYILGGQVDEQATSQVMAYQVLYILSLPVVPVQQP